MPWPGNDLNVFYIIYSISFLDNLGAKHLYLYRFMNGWFLCFLLMYRWLCHNYMDPMGSSFLGIHKQVSYRFLSPLYVVVSHMFYFHPEYWGTFPTWLAHISFRWVGEKTHQPARGEAHPTENPGRHELPRKENKIQQGRERLRTFFSSMLGPRFMGI